MDFWVKTLGLEIFNQSETEVLLGYSKNQAKLKLKCIGITFLFKQSIREPCLNNTYYLQEKKWNI